MSIWFDARDQRAEAWGGADPPDRRGDDVRGVLERAHRTALPYEFERDRTYGPDVVTEEFDERDYRHARVYVHGGVESNHRLKLLVKGHLWGADERHLRFRAQFRREAVPTETVPFDEYLVWSRYCEGTVRQDDDGGIDFEPAEDGVEEETEDLPWDEVVTPMQQFVTELELVRNPPLARYVLCERDRWATVRGELRWTPEAFDVPP
ncbi:MAG: hypothetical protein ABEJ78_09050 [Haloferacaceae archaeon]